MLTMLLSEDKLAVLNILESCCEAEGYSVSDNSGQCWPVVGLCRTSRAGRARQPGLQPLTFIDKPWPARTQALTSINRTWLARPPIPQALASPARKPFTFIDRPAWLPNP